VDVDEGLPYRVAAEFRPLLFTADRHAIGTALLGWVRDGLTPRAVRGRKMRTLAGLFDEFAATLQFPLYFGENKDAFDECIAEMDALPAGAGYVVVITDYVVVITEPDQVLADAAVGDLAWLVDSLANAAEAWARPIDLGESWDRPAVPFHVVLAGESDVVGRAAHRWGSVGPAAVAIGRSD
jgi:hypothetical protein